jgi:transposase
MFMVGGQENRRGPKKNVPAGLTPEVVRKLNEEGIPDKDISIMFDRSISYVSRLKKQWQKEGIWVGTTKTWKRNAK